MVTATGSAPPRDDCLTGAITRAGADRSDEVATGSAAAAARTVVKAAPLPGSAGLTPALRACGSLAIRGTPLGSETVGCGGMRESSGAPAGPRDAADPGDEANRTGAPGRRDLVSARPVRAGGIILTGQAAGVEPCAGIGACACATGVSPWGAFTRAGADMRDEVAIGSTAARRPALSPGVEPCAVPPRDDGGPCTRGRIVRLMAPAGCL